MPMPHEVVSAEQKRHAGLARVVRAMGYSKDGLRHALLNEGAFRQECALALVMLPAAFWLGDSWVEVGVLAASVMLVLIVELLNSSIEATVDRISLERHPLAKNAKDMGSAAVLLALLTAGGLWTAALWQRFVG